jgi:pilus assembly protein Flp/PilA
MSTAAAHLTTLVRLVCTRLGSASKGATAVEYGLLVALIAAVIIGSVTLFGADMSSLFSKLATSIK